MFGGGKLMKIIRTTLALAACVFSVSAYAAELDDALKHWLQQKPSNINLANEEKEIIIFLQDDRRQNDLSGYSFVQALSKQRVESRRFVAKRTEDLQKTYRNLENREVLWASQAIVSSTTRSFLNKIKDDPRIEAIILNQVIELETPMRGVRPVTADERKLTYGLQLVGAEKAWNLGVTGAGVRVGIIDSGIDAEHPDLKGKIVLSRDFTKDGHTNDRNGHGTHVAGTIAGGDSSGTQIGVAPGAELLIAKVFDNRGSTDMATLLRAMEWMLNPDGNDSTNDAPRVVNNSWGADSQFIIGFRNIVQTWRRFQVFPNFAAGNSGPRWMSTGAPARYPFSYAVAAVNESTEVASFSSRGPSLWIRAWGMGEGLPWYKRWAPLLYTKPDISAPGYEVLSSLPGGQYGRYSGTSMATPHVSGVIALLLEANPELSITQIENVLNETAIDLRDNGKDNASGHGLIQAHLAIQAAMQMEGELTDRFVDSNLSEWNWQSP